MSNPGERKFQGIFLDLNLKSSYQIASLFDMYIDMGQRIAAKLNRPAPPPHPPNSQKCKTKSHSDTYVNKRHVGLSDSSAIYNYLSGHRKLTKN